MDDRFGFEQIDVTSKRDEVEGRRVFVNGIPRAVRLIGGPRDGEVVDRGAPDYIDVTAYGDTERTAVWSPIIEYGPPVQ
jgi:hypothetical protein